MGLCISPRHLQQQLLSELRVRREQSGGGGGHKAPPGAGHQGGGQLLALAPIQDVGRACPQGLPIQSLQHCRGKPLEEGGTQVGQGYRGFDQK